MSEADDALVAALVDDVPDPYKSAYKASSRNRERLMTSRWVGCFYCLMIYLPESIREWTDGNQTAICPICHVDSVLPLTVEQFDSDFLEQMRRYWFSTTEMGRA